MKAWSGLLIGFTAGAAAMAKRRSLAPWLTDVARPVTKVLLRRSHMGVERLRTSAARTAEALDDLLAEARAEVDAELARGRGADHPERMDARASSASADSPRRR